MHKVLAGSTAAGMCLLILFLGLQQKSLYLATSRVFVDPVDPGAVTSQGGPGYDQLRYVSYVDQQMQTVTRDDILGLALQGLPTGTWRRQDETEQAAIGRLAKALKVERPNDGYEFSISLSLPDPEAAAAVVNAVAHAYLQGGRKDELKQADGRVQILNEERQRIKAELEADQREQAGLAGSLGVANPANDATNQFDTQLVNLRAQLAIAREAHDIAAARLAAVSGSDAEQRSGLAAAADESLSTDQGLGSMRSAVNARRTILESAMAGMTEKNPVYEQDQEELANLDRLQETETAKKRGQAEQRIQDSLRTDLERTGSVEAKLNAQLAQETAKATGAEPKLLRAQELANDLRRLNDRYTAVDVASRTLELQTNGPGTAHVSSVAEPPPAPESDRRTLFFLAAVPLGALFGIFAAVLARTMDSRVYTAADVQEVLGFAPLAVLPSEEEASPRAFDAHVLRLAAGLEGAYRRSSARTFVLTAVSGRTDTAMLVAAVAGKLQQIRLRTAVVPASELLLTSWETAEYQSQTAENQRIPDGISAPQPGLGGGIVSDKLERIKRAHDLVLIEGPALLHSAETEYASRCADATILVAESRVTRRHELTAAAELLVRVQVRGVALVLDKLQLGDADDAFRKAVDTAEDDIVTNRATPEVAPHSRFGTRDHHQTRDAEFEEKTTETPPTDEFRKTEYMASTVEEPPVLAPQGASSKDATLPEVCAATLSKAEPASHEPLHTEHDLEDSESVDAEPLPFEPASTEDEPVETTHIEGEQTTTWFAVEPILIEANEAEPEPVLAYGAGSIDSQDLGSEPTLRQSCVASGLSEDAPLNPATAEHSGKRAVSSATNGHMLRVVPGIASKIRFAFKENQLNSQANWLQHFLRGNSSSTLKVTPDEQYASVAGEGHESIGGGAKSNQEKAELDHLMKRISSRSHQVAGMGRAPESVFEWHSPESPTRQSAESKNSIEPIGATVSVHASTGAHASIDTASNLPSMQPSIFEAVTPEAAGVMDSKAAKEPNRSSAFGKETVTDDSRASKNDWPLETSWPAKDSWPAKVPEKASASSGERAFESSADEVLFHDRELPSESGVEAEVTARPLVAGDKALDPSPHRLSRRWALLSHYEFEGRETAVANTVNSLQGLKETYPVRSREA